MVVETMRNHGAMENLSLKISVVLVFIDDVRPRGRSQKSWTSMYILIR